MELLQMNEQQAVPSDFPSVRLSFAPEDARDEDMVSNVLGMLLHDTYTGEKE